jgi:hypothetical protein
MERHTLKQRSPSATEGYVPMRISFLLPLVFLGLAGCVTSVHEPPAQATVVTPAPQATYTQPSSTTVVRTP